MNRAAAPLARHRRAPLSEILSATRPGAMGRPSRPDFAATTFSPLHEDSRAFAPTQFVERRREPRLALAAVPSLAGAGGHQAFSAPLDDAPGFATPSRAGDDDADGAGRHGVMPALERLLDRLTPAPIGTLLALVVVLSLAMSVISALLPFIDQR